MLRIEPTPYRIIRDTTQALDRVFFTAADGSETSFFRKRLRRDAPPSSTIPRIFAASGDVSRLGYWRREIEAYRHPLLHAPLAEGLRAPHCYAIEEDLATATLWLEDIRGIPARSWTLDRFAVAMRGLGRFQGRFLAGTPLPDAPWLSTGELRAWSPAIDYDRTDSRLVRLRDERDALLARVEAAPRTVVHNDCWTANLLSVDDVAGNAQTILIDWASLGIGAIGHDLVNAVFDSVWMFELEAGSLDALWTGAFTAYVCGLRDAGSTCEAALILQTASTIAGLRFGVLAPGVQAAARNPQKAAELSVRYGLPAEHIFETRAAVADRALQLFEENSAVCRTI